MADDEPAVLIAHSAGCITTVAWASRHAGPVRAALLVTPPYLDPFLGIGTRLAAVAGALLLVMMWTAVLPPENNPFMDDHLIYAGLLAGLALVNAGDTLGLGRAWAKLPVVQRLPWLK